MTATESEMKEKTKQCAACKGLGFKTLAGEYEYNAKGQPTYEKTEQCHYCKGTGETLHRSNASQS